MDVFNGVDWNGKVIYSATFKSQFKIFSMLWVYGCECFCEAGLAQLEKQLLCASSVCILGLWLEVVSVSLLTARKGGCVTELRLLPLCVSLIHTESQSATWNIKQVLSCFSLLLCIIHLHELRKMKKLQRLWHLKRSTDP